MGGAAMAAVWRAGRRHAGVSTAALAARKPPVHIASRSWLAVDPAGVARRRPAPWLCRCRHRGLRRAGRVRTGVDRRERRFTAQAAMTAAAAIVLSELNLIVMCLHAVAGAVCR